MIVTPRIYALGAVKLADSIESWMSKQCKKPVQLPELLDIILKESFSTLIVATLKVNVPRWTGKMVLTLRGHLGGT